MWVFQLLKITIRTNIENNINRNLVIRENTNSALVISYEINYICQISI